MIKYSVKSNTGIVKFNRPEALNALNSDTIKELKKIIGEVKEDSNIKSLVFTGEGKAFISGADVSEMEDLRGDKAREFTILGRDLFREIELLNIPTIAALNGFTLGGGLEFALCCDLRISNEKAKFGMPEVGLGVVPGFSGSQRLPRLIGMQDAKYLLYTGEIIGAEKAKEIGLVLDVFEGDVLEEALKIAEKINQNSTYAIGLLKEAISLGTEINFDAAKELETGLVVSCFGSDDQIEGMEAFRDGRKPEFK